MAYENRVKPNLFTVKHFSIDAESFIWDDTQMMCADVTGFAYGATVTKVEGIKAHTYHHFQCVDSSNDEMAFSFYAGEFMDDPVDAIAGRLIAEMWSAFGNRILTNFINTIIKGGKVKCGRMTFDKNGAMIQHRPIFGKNRDVVVPWEQIDAQIFQGNLTIKAGRDAGVSDVLVLAKDYNAHVILEIIRMTQKDPSFIHVLSGK